MASMGLIPNDTIVVYGISENASRKQMEDLFRGKVLLQLN
jgi:hypothetical protein